MTAMGKWTRRLAPALALGMATSLAACDGEVSVNGETGQALAALDLSGPPPGEVVLMGPDRVTITPGERLAITVEGDKAATERLRFVLKDGTLAIMRQGKSYGYGAGNQPATVRVTMPAPRKLAMLGSGTITSAQLARDGEITVAGSGTVDAGSLGGGKLEVTLPGSGRARAAGAVDALELSILGSGAADLAGVKAGAATVSIAGSGDASFASDGAVNADIMGSGTVTVRGTARCTVNKMGSGRLACDNPAQ